MQPHCNSLALKKRGCLLWLILQVLWYNHYSAIPAQRCGLSFLHAGLVLPADGTRKVQCISVIKTPGYICLSNTRSCPSRTSFACPSSGPPICKLTVVWIPKPWSALVDLLCGASVISLVFVKCHDGCWDISRGPYYTQHGVLLYCREFRPHGGTSIFPSRTVVQSSGEGSNSERGGGGQVTSLGISVVRRWIWICGLCLHSVFYIPCTAVLVRQLGFDCSRYESSYHNIYIFFVPPQAVDSRYEDLLSSATMLQSCAGGHWRTTSKGMLCNTVTVCQLLLILLLILLPAAAQYITLLWAVFGLSSPYTWWTLHSLSCASTLS